MGLPRTEKLHRRLFGLLHGFMETHLILASWQRRRNQGHLGASALGQKPPSSVDDHPQPVHVKAAVPECGLLDLMAGARLDGVDVERSNLGFESG